MVTPGPWDSLPEPGGPIGRGRGVGATAALLSGAECPLFQSLGAAAHLCVSLRGDWLLESPTFPS